MHISGKNVFRHIFRTAIAAAAGWTAVVSISLGWALYSSRQQSLEIARREAAVYIAKDIAFRNWATSHGGVYVPPTEKTPPNPYLSHVPDRDVETTSGKRLTLMNPAYVLREMQTHFSGPFGEKGRIISLKPLNPINAPDAWERQALEQFERGAKEVREIVDIAEIPHFRMMKPFYVEKGCLKCHGRQGYQLGDVRGGIAVTLSLAPFIETANLTARNLAVGHGVVWLFGVAGIALFARQSTRREKERQEADAARNLAADEISKLNSELEQRVLNRTAQLEAANKELEAFSFSVSHDLRAPLRAIDGFSNALLEDYGDKLDDEGKHFLQMLSDNAVKMGKLIDSILSFSRLGRREIEGVELDFGGLADDVIAELRESAPGRNIRFAVGPLPPARGDRVMIRQVLVNLLANAVKFTRPRAEAVIELGGASEAEENVYYVKDNGVGFDMDYAEKLFGVFQRLHVQDEFEGSGIGLAIVKRIVERHGGRVWAQGRVGEGATIYFTLPRAPRPSD